MSAGIVFGVIILLLILAAAVTFLILWLNSRNKKNTEVKDLNITGTKFTLNNQVAVTAAWESIGNSKDQVVLYADTTPINFNSDGTPDTSKSPKVLSSNKVSGNAKTVTLTGLNTNTKYYLDLVVTNPDFTGFNPVSETIHTNGNVPETSFIIQELHTNGGISLDVNDSSKVTYDTKANKTDVNDLWSYDKVRFTISSRNLGITSTANRPTLYNNNGVLAAKNAQATPSSDSQWEYNTKGDNKWCIKGTDVCMDLEQPVKDGQEIKLVSGANTKWTNNSVTTV